MPSLYTEIEIDASVQRVWQALYHKENWLKWNTFLFDCDSAQPFEQGKEVWLSIRRLPGDEETEFHPRVILVQPPFSLRWFSQIPGLRNEHSFELQEIGQNRTKYVHRESFSGWMTRAFLPFIRREEQQGIKRMAMELKRHVERKQLVRTYRN
jgi:hypothetical protein